MRGPLTPGHTTPPVIFFYVGCKTLGAQHFRKIDHPTYKKNKEPKPLKTILFGKNLLI